MRCAMQLAPGALVDRKDELMEILMDYRAVYHSDNSNTRASGGGGAGGAGGSEDDEEDELTRGGDDDEEVVMERSDVFDKSGSKSLIIGSSSSASTVMAGGSGGGGVRSLKRASSSSSSSASAGEKAKAKKYSEAETNLMMKVTYEYLKANNITPEEFCVALQSSEKVVKVKRPFWKELQYLMPHREMRSIQHHVKRQLVNRHNSRRVSEANANAAAADGGAGGGHHAKAVPARWTQDEKDALAELVKNKGFKWGEIGRSLERHPGETKRDNMMMSCHCALLTIVSLLLCRHVVKLLLL